jgi:hypothetical protein
VFAPVNNEWATTNLYRLPTFVIFLFLSGLPIGSNAIQIDMGGSSLIVRKLATQKIHTNGGIAVRASECCSSFTNALPPPIPANCRINKFQTWQQNTRTKQRPSSS